MGPAPIANCRTQAEVRLQHRYRVSPRFPDTFLTSRPEVICTSIWTIFHDHMSDTNYCLVSLSSRPDRFPLPVSLQGRVHLCTPCKQTNVTPWFHSSGHVFIRLGFPARIAAATQQFLHGFTSQAMSFPVMIAAAYIVVFTLVFSSGHVLNKVAKLSVAYLEVSFLSRPEPGSPVGGSLSKPSSVLSQTLSSALLSVLP